MTSMLQVNFIISNFIVINFSFVGKFINILVHSHFLKEKGDALENSLISAVLVWNRNCVICTLKP